MNNLQIFNNPEFGGIRTIQKDGEPRFVGKDVATTLGYSNAKNALAKHIAEEPTEARRIEKELQGDVTKLLRAFVVAGVDEEQIKGAGVK